MDAPSTPHGLARARAEADGTGPDGCELRALVSTPSGLVTEHRTLRADAASTPLVRHVDEVWWIVQGRGRVWRRTGEHEDVGDLGPGVAVAVPAGTAAQVVNVGDGPLRYVATASGVDDREPEVVTGRW